MTTKSLPKSDNFVLKICQFRTKIQSMHCNIMKMKNQFYKYSYEWPNRMYCRPGSESCFDSSRVL